MATWFSCLTAPAGYPELYWQEVPMYIREPMYIRVPMYIHGGQMTIFWNQFSPSTVSPEILKRKKRFLNFEPSFKQALLEHWSGWWTLASSTLGFQGLTTHHGHILQGVKNTNPRIHFISHQVQSRASIPPDVFPAYIPSTHMWSRISSADRSNKLA